MRGRAGLTALIVAAAGGGCVTSDRVALGTSLAALACDISQTALSASEGWKYSTETNPILHDRGPEAVIAYGVVGAAVITAAWYLLPRSWRTVGGVAVTAAEMYAVNDSYPRRHICFGPGRTGPHSPGVTPR